MHLTGANKKKLKTVWSIFIKMTCNECRWKIEKHECPWDFMYDEPNVDYAEDCIDYRAIYTPSDAFKEVYYE